MAKTILKKSKWRITAWVAGGMVAVVLLVVAAGFYAFGPFAPMMFMWLLVPSPWQSTVVPLPDGKGEITVQFRASHPFLAEYDRRIDIRLADGRRLRSPIVGNTGGRTFLLLFWQTEGQGTGPFLMLEDKQGATWIDTQKLCLHDSFKGIDSIAVEDRCQYATLPTSMDWTYLGRIDARDGDRRYIPGDQWPPDDTEIPWHIWPPVPLPDSRWSFEAIERPYPRWHLQHVIRHWLVLHGPDGVRLQTWFRTDYFGEHIANLYWYPEREGDGPYLQIGLEDGAIIDLRRRRTYRLFYSWKRHFPASLSGPEVFAIQPDAEVADTTVGFDAERARFLAERRDGSEYVLQSLPAIVEPGKGVHVGHINTWDMTFTPAAGK